MDGTAPLPNKLPYGKFFVNRLRTSLTPKGGWFLVIATTIENFAQAIVLAPDNDINQT